MKELALDIVSNVIEKYSLDCQVIACDPTQADTAAFCEAYGYSPEEAANTIIVTSRKVEPTVYAVCVVLAATRLDVNKAVVAQMGVKKASFADAETTKDLSSMEIGGVCAVGIESLPIYIDEAVMNCSQVIMGGGNRSSKLVLSPKELLKLPNATVVKDLSKVSA